MDDTIRTVVQWSILVVTLFGFYVTRVHLKWWKLYKPSPLVKHLLISSIVVDISASILSFIVVMQLIGVTLPTGVGLTLVGLALLLSLGVKAYRRFDLRNLDYPDEDIRQRSETQDQREDRQFGDQRRELEQEHAEESNGADQK